MRQRDESSVTAAPDIANRMPLSKNLPSGCRRGASGGQRSRNRILRSCRAGRRLLQLSLVSLRIVFAREDRAKLQQLAERAVPERRAETEQKRRDENPRELARVRERLLEALLPTSLAGQRDDASLEQEVTAPSIERGRGRGCGRIRRRASCCP